MSDTIVEYRILSTPIKVQVLRWNNSDFREVTAASKLHKYNQTVPVCIQKDSSFGFCKFNLPKVMHTNRHPEKSSYATDGKKIC